MVAIPAPLGIERDHEQVGALGASKQRGGILSAGEGPAQPGIKPLGDRGPDEERTQVVVDAAEDLVGEVVEDEALAATEGIDDRGRIRSVRQGDCCQLEACDPALGALDEALHELRLERETRVGEVGGRLLAGVAQVIGAQLDEPAVSAQAGEWQRRVLASQQDEMEERRPVVDEETDQSVDRLGRHGLEVVEKEDEGVVSGRDLVEERGTDQVRAGVRPGSEEAQRRRANVRPDRPKRCHDVANETGEIVVGRIEREPGAGKTARREPAGYGDRLAVSRRSGQEGQAGAVIEPPIEQRTDPRTLAVSRNRGRRLELRPDDGDSRFGVSRCGRRHRPDYRWQTNLPPPLPFIRVGRGVRSAVCAQGRCERCGSRPIRTGCR